MALKNYAQTVAQAVRLKGKASHLDQLMKDYSIVNLGLSKSC